MPSVSQFNLFGNVPGNNGCSLEFSIDETDQLVEYVLRSRSGSMRSSKNFRRSSLASELSDFFRTIERLFRRDGAMPINLHLQCYFDDKNVIDGTVKINDAEEILAKFNEIHQQILNARPRQRACIPCNII